MRFAVVFVLCLIVLVPISFALAASDLPSQIVPCDGTTQNPCNLCHLVELAQRLINTGIFVMIILSAMMFAYGGMLYMSASGDPSKASKGRSILTHVAVGLIIILAAWLAVDTLMKTMVDESKIGPWNSIGCSQTAGFTR